ncbi:hypothetical protein CCUS01_05556 [Colletotrichum cuscutae]|uniref:Uncharacterized protein n=1 Tax=Colletotrichum cuscutae TaxID=1209917 RepID=A0AAI9Y545_9PEZI|nr:hypothetical protein CCUS01_05556 [Colletotrichum cuscutae]
MPAELPRWLGSSYLSFSFCCCLRRLKNKKTAITPTTIPTTAPFGGARCSLDGPHGSVGCHRLNRRSRQRLLVLVYGHGMFRRFGIGLFTVGPDDGGMEITQNHACNSRYMAEGIVLTSVTSAAGGAGRSLRQRQVSVVPGQISLHLSLTSASLDAAGATSEHQQDCHWTMAKAPFVCHRKAKAELAEDDFNVLALMDADFGFWRSLAKAKMPKHLVVRWTITFEIEGEEVILGLWTYTCWSQTLTGLTSDERLKGAPKGKMLGRPQESLTMTLRYRLSRKIGADSNEVEAGRQVGRAVAFGTRFRAKGFGCENPRVNAANNYWQPRVAKHRWIKQRDDRVRKSPSITMVWPEVRADAVFVVQKVVGLAGRGREGEVRPRVEKKQAPRGRKRREGDKPQEQGRKWTSERASEQKQQNAIRKVLTGQIQQASSDSTLSKGRGGKRETGDCDGGGGGGGGVFPLCIWTDVSLVVHQQRQRREGGGRERKRIRETKGKERRFQYRKRRWIEEEELQVKRQKPGIVDGGGGACHAWGEDDGGRGGLDARDKTVMERMRRQERRTQQHTGKVATLELESPTSGWLELALQKERKKTKRPGRKDTTPFDCDQGQEGTRTGILRTVQTHLTFSGLFLRSVCFSKITDHRIFHPIGLSEWNTTAEKPNSMTRCIILTHVVRCVRRQTRDKPQPSRYTITTHMLYRCIRIQSGSQQPQANKDTAESDTPPSSRRYNLHKDNQDPFVFSPCLYNARRPFAVLAILDLVSLTLQAALRQGTRESTRHPGYSRMAQGLGLISALLVELAGHADGPTGWMSRRGVRQSQSCVPPAAVSK